MFVKMKFNVWEIMFIHSTFSNSWLYLYFQNNYSNQYISTTAYYRQKVSLTKYPVSYCFNSSKHFIDIPNINLLEELGTVSWFINIILV